MNLRAIGKIVGVFCGATVASYVASTCIAGRAKLAQNAALLAHVNTLTRVADVCDNPAAAHAVLQQIHIEVAKLDKWVELIRSPNDHVFDITDMQHVQDIANKLSRLANATFESACGDNLDPTVALDLDSAGKQIVREVVRTTKAIEGRLTNALHTSWQTSRKPLESVQLSRHPFSVQP